MSQSKRPTRETVPGLGKVSDDVIYPHIFDNADREVGGVLVGRPSKEGRVPLVTGAIPAISADEQRSTLTFTQDSWEFIHNTMDSKFPEDDEIVGWYHSHPNFGIFLSGHDLFIHENFFSGASQIAVVVDPVNCTEGTFVWNDKQIEKLYEVPTPEEWAAAVPKERLKITTRSLKDVGLPPGSAASAAARRSSGLTALAGAGAAAVVFAIAAIVIGGGGGDSVKPAQAVTIKSTKFNGKFGDYCLDHPNATKDKNGHLCDPNPPAAPVAAQKVSSGGGRAPAAPLQQTIIHQNSASSGGGGGSGGGGTPAPSCAGTRC